MKKQTEYITAQEVTALLARLEKDIFSLQEAIAKGQYKKAVITYQKIFDIYHKLGPKASKYHDLLVELYNEIVQIAPKK